MHEFVKKTLLVIGGIAMLVAGFSFFTTDIFKQFKSSLFYQSGKSIKPEDNVQIATADVKPDKFEFDFCGAKRILSPEEELEFEKNKREAEVGNPEAQLKLGHYYESDEINAARAVEWYLKAAEQGNVDAEYRLGVIYSEGQCIPKEATKAMEWMQKAAEQGLAKAQNYLGMFYSDGTGVPKDSAKAAEWYQKAAAQENADAQLNLGVLYSNGNGVAKDENKAIEWFQKSAEQGNANAQYILGAKYAHGDNVSKDDAKSVEWYQKAAAQGHAEAQNNLGYAYKRALGVTKNDAEAVKWYQKAAEQGNVDAQFNLGNAYLDGAGVPKDEAKAFEWFQKAAVQGDADAQVNLGYAYFNGKGVSKNIILAYGWSNLAAAQGNEVGKNNRDKYEKQLTDAERTEGQKLASNWKKGNFLNVFEQFVDRDFKPVNEGGNIEKSKRGTGTAFIVSSDGHALTNHHVINGCAGVKIAGREGDVKVITSDSVNDIALLQLPGKSVDIAKLNPEPSKLRQGEDVIVFGYPLNFALSSGGNLTPGTISALTGLGNNTNQIQITAPIQPGSSGSPVMDKKGDVVAVVSMKLDDGKMTKLTGQVGQNVNFAVNGQTVRTFLDANKVPYKTGGGFFSYEKNNADIADEARKWTVLVECWK